MCGYKGKNFFFSFHVQLGILYDISHFKLKMRYPKWVQIMYEEASQVANDAVRNIRTVASFCAEENVITLYKNKCECPRRAGMKLGVVTGITLGISFFLLFSAYAISFYVGSRLVEDGKTTFAKVFRVCTHNLK